MTNILQPLQTTLPWVDLSLWVLGVAAVLWIVQKVIDNIADRIIDKKLFEPIYQRAQRKYKIIRTKAEPVASEFSVSYTPEEKITVSEVTERLPVAFSRAEQTSNGKITVQENYWSDEDRKGRAEIHYLNQTEVFNIDVTVIQDTSSLRANPAGEPDEVLVGSIGVDIKFKYPFDLLEETLFNLQSLISYLETGFEDQIRGSFSGGRFVISPVNTNLTLDEWVEEEQFDVSLLLAGEDDNRTEVEFFSDRAVVKSNQREIDGQTVNYMRELLLNYYL